MSHPFTSKLILGAAPPQETIDRLVAGGFIERPDADTELSMSVFQVRVDGTTRYCAWAGGYMDRENPTLPFLTPFGQAAVDALLTLPFVVADQQRYTLVFQEVRLGATPLPRKVRSCFRMTADVNALVVFVGDLAKELDGHMFKTMNPVDGIHARDCKPPRKPGDPA